MRFCNSDECRVMVYMDEVKGIDEDMSIINTNCPQCGELGEPIHPAISDRMFN